MLDLAFNYQEQLQERWRTACTEFKNIYALTTRYTEYTIPIKEDDWEKIQMVSVNDEGEVLGYFEADITQTSNVCHSMLVISFTQNSRRFIQDMFAFIHHLLCVRNYSKIGWTVVPENTAAVRLYDRAVRELGARYVGTYKKHTVLRTGKIVDLDIYELLREDYLEAAASHPQHGKFIPAIYT